jgi:hypothetical protein
MEKEIWCCECQNKINARLTDGQEIYPHRSDLYNLPFWKCDQCNNFVGCHHKTKEPTKPLGNIPTKEIKEARKHIHSLLDPIWKSSDSKTKTRKSIYNYLSDQLGFSYHTATLRTIEEARKVYKLLIQYRRNHG